MEFIAKKEAFEQRLPEIYERVVLKFSGIDGYDVYNCSIPFVYNGKKYIFGRVEKRDVWADSSVMMFFEKEPDCFTAMPETVLYPLEDPFICRFNNEWVLGGVHVVKSADQIKYGSTYFYKGTDPFERHYFTTGPKGMKDIRISGFENKLAVFTRPEGQVGFTLLNSVDEITEENLQKAAIIDLVGRGGHGGVNQAIPLKTGLIALIGHDSYSYPDTNDWYSQNHIYSVTASVFDPKTGEIIMNEILATRKCFLPDTPEKVLTSGIKMSDVVFPSGILLRADGRIDLYAGVSDACMQRIVIDNPFKEYGEFADAFF